MEDKDVMSPENEQININADDDVPGKLYLSNPGCREVKENVKVVLGKIVV